ncbi:hypothetical protein MPSEU_001094900 [Mayamaea pseudoterrestris]|nr:hypothetical protein MPSEU_001094900 [Mayamaea pseudoterrestris]
MSHSTPPPEWDLLLSAAQKNDSHQIQKMVASGVDPSHSNAVGQSALHIAALWGNVEAAEALLTAGANSNAQNRIMGSTPLHMAAQSNKATVERMKEIVDLLLAHGANLQLVDSNGAMPLKYVTRPELESKFQVRAPDLYLAIDLADIAEFTTLLQQSDGKLNQYDGKTPVAYAANKLNATFDEINDSHELSRRVSTYASMLDQLFDTGAISTQETTYNLLLALERVYRNSEDETSAESLVILELVSLKSLQRQEGNPAPSTDVCLLAHAAARRGHLRMLQFLLERVNIDPNTTNRQGMTALHFAARSGQEPIVQYLLSLNDADLADKVDVIAKDSLGQTALDAARTNNKTHVVRLLEAYLGR